MEIMNLVEGEQSARIRHVVGGTDIEGVIKTLLRKRIVNAESNSLPVIPRNIIDGK